MEAVMFLASIAFIAGLVVRSAFTRQQQPQIVYVQTEPVEPNGSGCLPLILVGALLLLLLLAGSG